MPKALSIIKPLPITQIGDTSATYSGLANVLTPNPKEIAVSDIFTLHYIDLDFGAAVDMDSFFIGFLDKASAGLTVNLYTQPTFQGARTVVAGGNLVLDPITDTFRHGFVQLAAPINTQFLSFRISGAAVPESIGVLAVGRSWSSALGHEWGAGRGLEDSSTVERLFGGGFGISEGAVVGGYDWTFGDLTDVEREDLFGLLLKTGASKTILVAEEPDAATYVGNRLHWGLFDRFEKFERLIPGATRWSLKIRDWG